MLNLVPSTSDLYHHHETLSTAKHSSVLSLLEKGYSHCQIHYNTGVGMGTISRIGKEMDSQKQNNPGGHPFKLSACDKQSIV